MSPQFIIYFSGAGIAGFVFNETIDEGVTGVLAAAENVNGSLIEIETKVWIFQSYLTCVSWIKSLYFLAWNLDLAVEAINIILLKLYHHICNQK